MELTFAIWKIALVKQEGIAKGGNVWVILCLTFRRSTKQNS